MKSSFLLCANWKMNKDPEEVRNYLRWILHTADLEAQKHFVFFVPALSAFVCRDELVKSSVQWGGQNCYFEDQGAFTGENSPQVLRAMGARYCLVGHSERRHLFGEDDNIALLKVRALWRSGVRPVLCVGETREEKESGQSIDVVRRQLYGVLEELKEISESGEQNLQQSNYLSPHLKNSLKSSDMRFAAKRACSRFAFKAELVLSKLFKRGDSHNLQSGDIHAEELRRSVSGGSPLAVAYEPVWAIGAGSAADFAAYSADV